MKPPSLTKVAFNESTGLLTLTGINLTTSGYKVNHFTIKGDGGISYTLTSGSVIFGVPTSSSVVIKLSSADQLAVDGLLNKNGTHANDSSSTAYNLSATAGWDTGASAILTEAVTVSGVTAPTISSVSYNAGKGIFTFKGNNFDNHGSANGIALNHFTLKGGVSGNYKFSANDNVSNLSSTSFTVTLSGADKTAVNAFVNANGVSPISGAAYNLTASAKWDSDSGVAITNQALTVSAVVTPPTLNTVYFSATDAKGLDNLFSYNGSKLTEITTASANSSSGLSPTDLTVVSGIVYMDGYDANGLYNLFSYNGLVINELVNSNSPKGLYNGYIGSYSSGNINPELTRIDNTLYMRGYSEKYFMGYDTGAYENLFSYNGSKLTEITSPAGSPYVFNPDHLTAVGNSLYMRGVDINNHDNLFLYNGSSLTEITSPFASSGGLFNNNYPTYSPDLTAVGGSLYMVGADSKGNINLFSCNGITLKEITYALLSSSADPKDLTALGNTLYFGAQDVNGFNNLFSYNSSTVKEISSPLVGQYGLFESAYMNSPDLIAVGSSLYMQGIDTKGYDNLFSYNGSTLTEITSPFASRGGLFYYNQLTYFPDLTAVGTSLYMVGVDINNNNNLFSYNGSVLTEITSSLMFNVSSGNTPIIDFNPSNLTAVGNTLYMQGTDASGQVELFSYNGSTLTEITGGSTGIHIVGTSPLVV